MLQKVSTAHLFWFSALFSQGTALRCLGETEVMLAHFH
jgi:hypothetical protein